MGDASVVPPIAEALARYVDVGVLITADDVVVLANRPFLRAFGVSESGAENPASEAELTGQPVTVLAERLPFRAAADFWAARHEGSDRSLRWTLRGDRVVEGRWHRLPSDGDRLLVAVVEDLTSDVRIRRRLRRHNRALAELVATKTELVTALLHELRTPLASALAMADMLPDRVADPELDEGLSLIVRSLRRIGKVTTEITTIAGIEKGVVALDHSEFDLPALVAEVAAQTGGTAIVPADSPAFVGDRERLQEVLRRLVEVVRALGTDDAELIVAQVGAWWRIGLPLPSHQATDRLFTAAGSGGSATALMLARAVVGRHGGSVGVESEDGSPYLVVCLPCRGVDVP